MRWWWPLTCYTLPLVVPLDLKFLIKDSERVADVLFFARENISLRYFSRTPTCEPGILKWGPSEMELLDPGTRDGRYFGDGRGILIWLGDNFCYWGSLADVDIIFFDKGIFVGDCDYDKDDEYDWNWWLIF